MCPGGQNLYGRAAGVTRAVRLKVLDRERLNRQMKHTEIKIVMILEFASTLSISRSIIYLTYLLRLVERVFTRDLFVAFN